MYKKKGFTLIELLVAVLIIGVLAAVALPQYTRAVEKSRAAKMISSVRALHDAQQRYYLANGTFAKSFEELDIDFGSSLSGGSSQMQSCARGASFMPASADAMRDGGDYEIAIGSVYGVIYSVAYHKKHCAAVFMGFAEQNTASTSVRVPDTSTVYCSTGDYAGERKDWCSKTFGTNPGKDQVPLALSVWVVKVPAH